MKYRILAPVAALAVALAWLMMGCDREQSATDDPEVQMTDQEALELLFLDDLEMEGADIWGGEGEFDGGGGLDEPITPLHWARLGHRGNAFIHVDIRGDSMATIVRHLDFHGVFRIVSDTTDTSFTLIDKPMHNVLVRKARAVRVAHTPRPRLNWRIVAITPEVLHSSDPNPHTIWPVHASIHRRGAEGLEPVAEIHDPLETWLHRENLPTVHPEDELLVFVNANRPGAFGVLHPHVHHLGRGGRLPLRDDGVLPDETAHDGIYTGSYIAGPRLGLHLVGIDLIDWMTLFDSEAPYDAGGWGVPYRVVPPER